MRRDFGPDKLVVKADLPDVVNEEGLKRAILMDTERFPLLLKAIYDAVDELERMFPGRHFTPDGHLVGSLGEALAAHYYNVQLSSASAECHDGTCDGLQVQVKATQGDRVGISSKPDYLLVLRLSRDGTFVEEYNGPGAAVWELVEHKPLPKNGQYQVSLSTLRRLMLRVPPHERLPRRPA